uniref:Uncharacterized protein n=1 Tax=Anopheles albimanus TaxID=7167 RepID=A0A182F1R6_ANOAL
MQQQQQQQPVRCTRDEEASVFGLWDSELSASDVTLRIRKGFAPASGLEAASLDQPSVPYPPSQDNDDDDGDDDDDDDDGDTNDDDDDDNGEDKTPICSHQQ